MVSNFCYFEISVLLEIANPTYLESKIGCALHEAVEEGVVLEVGQLLLPLQKAPSLVYRKLVDVLVGVDDLWGDRVEGLGARGKHEPVLYHFGHCDRGVEQQL